LSSFAFHLKGFPYTLEKSNDSPGQVLFCVTASELSTNKAVLFVFAGHACDRKEDVRLMYI
jgi:hypothetical protein